MGTYIFCFETDPPSDNKMDSTERERAAIELAKKHYGEVKFLQTQLTEALKKIDDLKRDKYKLKKKLKRFKEA